MFPRVTATAQDIALLQFREERIQRISEHVPRIRHLDRARSMMEVQARTRPTAADTAIRFRQITVLPTQGSTLTHVGCG